jgi:two-component system, OmpR family, sensor histidine kinase KdpD
MHDPDRRPDPEQLLRQVEAAEKEERWGRLKIFLGYASRVGKSFRMYDEGRRRKMRGQDVVVGFIQSKISPDLHQLLKTLEIIPSLQVTVNGEHYEVMDIPAVCRRCPRVCLVDELARNNPPGSRNENRWQDVQELLENGINVITAVNLQHIEDKQEDIEKIIGKRSIHTVPLEFIRSADEIVIVDLPPEDLQKRDQSERKITTQQLSALRELAFLLTAEVVEAQLQRYLRSHGIEMLWGSQERILVCITPQSNARKMLESGKRNADRFHCELIALYVRQKHLSGAEQSAVEENLELARNLGAKVLVMEAKDSVAAIVGFARAEGVTQLFVGHSAPGKWREILSTNSLDRLIHSASGMDVRIFPHAV